MRGALPKYVQYYRAAARRSGPGSCFAIACFVTTCDAAIRTTHLEAYFLTSLPYLYEVHVCVCQRPVRAGPGWKNRPGARTALAMAPSTSHIAWKQNRAFYFYFFFFFPSGIVDETSLLVRIPFFIIFFWGAFTSRHE